MREKEHIPQPRKIKRRAHGSEQTDVISVKIIIV